MTSSRSLSDPGPARTRKFGTLLTVRVVCSTSFSDLYRSKESKIESAIERTIPPGQVKHLHDLMPVQQLSWAFPDISRCIPTIYGLACGCIALRRLIVSQVFS